MKPKQPQCPDCGGKLPTLIRLISRVYAQWQCTKCGLEWRSDAATGRLITRLTSAVHLEGGK